jgi:hypothetical protein
MDICRALLPFWGYGQLHFYLQPPIFRHHASLNAAGWNYDVCTVVVTAAVALPTSKILLVQGLEFCSVSKMLQALPDDPVNRYVVNIPQFLTISVVDPIISPCYAGASSRLVDL